MAFSGDITTNLARQCRAFSRALKIEKFKAPLFRGPEGAGATNDWCIIKWGKFGAYIITINSDKYGITFNINRYPQHLQNLEYLKYHYSVFVKAL